MDLVDALSMLIQLTVVAAFVAILAPFAAAAFAVGVVAVQVVAIFLAASVHMLVAVAYASIVTTVQLLTVPMAIVLAAYLIYTALMWRRCPVHLACDCAPQQLRVLGWRLW